ncbi:DUF1963 domain-containing protein [Streptomyces sp. NPDC001508]|uniref:DUF1963 domain-containing protein n=1 Tax=Streptomyces sp. NPDC001508 TaxID=3154656 RepID=UPI00331E1AB7
MEYDIANAALGGIHAWGDEGTLYWLIRPEDLTARRFDQSRLTVRCQPAPLARPQRVS